MRSLPYNFELILQENRRRPAYKILAFDSKLDSMSAVVCGTYSQTPFDLTPYCSDISWTPGRLSFVLQDGSAIFHPDFGAQRRYLADAAIIRLVEGDANLAETDWTNSFTGQIQGQVGWRKARRDQTLESHVSVYSRENNQSWKRRSITTKTYSAGTEIGVVLRDVCTRFMGMTENEIRIPSTLGLQLKHQVNQLVQVAPWDGITSILEAVGAVPYFDGDGRLSCFSKAMSAPEARRLIDWTRILDYEVPECSQEAINKIRVIFLDSHLEQVDGTYQKLGEAQVTTGFFSRHECLPCWWGEDHKQRAYGTSMKVIKSVNSGLLPVGTERYAPIDDFHGEIHVDIAVWVPLLAGAMLIEYLALAAIPDHTSPGQEVIGTCPVAPGPVYAVTATPGVTIPWGRILQGQAMVGIMIIMMSMGSAQYEIWGTPYDYVYLEKQSLAIECNIEYWQENEREIKNDFLGTQEQADAIALLELIWEKSKCFPRKLLIQDDPTLEAGDMIRLPDGLKFFITGLSKSIKRGEVPLLSLDGFKVKGA